MTQPQIQTVKRFTIYEFQQAVENNDSLCGISHRKLLAMADTPPDDPKAVNLVLASDYDALRAAFSSLQKERDRLVERFSSLGELLGDPIGGDYCMIDEAIFETVLECDALRSRAEVLQEELDELKEENSVIGPLAKRNMLLMGEAATAQESERVWREGYDREHKLKVKAEAELLAARGRAKTDSEEALIAICLAWLNTPTSFLQGDIPEAIQKVAAQRAASLEGEPQG